MENLKHHQAEPGGSGVKAAFLKNKGLGYGKQTATGIGITPILDDTNQGKTQENAEQVKKKSDVVKDI